MVAGAFLKVVLVAAICFPNGAFGIEQEFQRIARELHNQFRGRHHDAPLLTNDDLNSRATLCAQYYATTMIIDHSCPFKQGAGENLWVQAGGSPSDIDAARSATNTWYSEETKYDYSQDYQAGTGHFSQMVWRSTREMGFGTARVGNMIVGCGLYTTPGNLIGQFRDNVIRP